MTSINTFIVTSGSKAAEVAKVLRERIEAGTYTGQLPGMAALAEEFGINERTVMRGVAVLEDEGLLMRKRGHGTFVTRLKRQRTHNIGVVFGGVSAPLGSQLAEGMQAAAGAAQHGLILSGYGADQDSQMERVRNMVERNQVDGLVLWLVGEEVPKEAITYLQSENVPLVMVPDFYPEFHENVHTVSGTEHGATSDVMTHLLGQGNRDIAFASDSVKKKSISHWHRYDEYCHSLKLAGISPHEPLTVSYENCNSEADAQVAEELKEVSAVFCETDRIAAGIHRICTREGICIPTDLAVVGFDNSKIAEMLDLSSVEQHFEQIGHKAVELLLEELEGNLEKPTYLEVESELVIRGSSVRKE